MTLIIDQLRAGQIKPGSFPATYHPMHMGTMCCYSDGGAHSEKHQAGEGEEDGSEDVGLHMAGA